MEELSIDAGEVGENGQLPTLKVETPLDRDGQTNLFSLEHPGL